MGTQEVKPITGQSHTQFLRHLLSDIRALDRMIESDLLESGITRIGAEQEFCLVQPNLRPALTGPKILESVNDPHFTSELARWNLEINLDPFELLPGSLRKIEAQLIQLMEKAVEVSRDEDSRVALTGILPTIRKSELEFDFMTPNPRYEVLNDSLKKLRGEDFSLYIEGVDEINLKHNSILFEACNTSFQVHLQIDPAEFADKYNWAQVIAGPVLAGAVNSPILLGKELWSETRIALFRQSIEIRHAGNYINDHQPRVAFGNQWLKESVVEIFKNDIAFYKRIMETELDEDDSMAVLDRGEIPKLRAMNLHNGTLYKWNRACYGVGADKPHLRIENRYLPSGPTIHDEMANFAFWIGLMHAMPDDCRGNWDQNFPFQQVRSNFLKAARNGLSNELYWFGKELDANELIVDKLLPMAESGLLAIGLPKSEFGEYFETIEQRVRTGQTGADWMIESLRSLRERNTADEASLMITHYLVENCMEEAPAHEWKIPAQSTLFQIPDRHARVDCLMVTNLVTVYEHDLVEFAKSLMDWNGFRHLPVENAQGELVGIITNNDIPSDPAQMQDCLVSELMTTGIVTVEPEDNLDEAEALMIEKGIGSLPVVSDQRIVGIVTASDIQRLRQRSDGNS